MATPVQVSTTLTKEALRRSWEQFLRKYKRSELDSVALAYPQETSLFVPYWQLSKHDDELADATLDNPTDSLEAASEAVRRLETPVDEELDITVRVRSLPDHWLIPVRDLRAEHLGRLIAIRGLVKKSSEVRPKLTVGAFECRRCGHKQYVEQDEHLTFKEPSGCPQCEKQSQFRFLEGQSNYVDTQRLELQEPPEGLRGGEQPERLAAYVEGDLAGDVAAGDRVVINGILKSDQRRIKGQDSTLFDLFSKVNSVEVQEQEFEEVNISEDEEQEIVEFSNDPDIAHTIIDSVAPTIQGMEMEKQALALQLFGGVAKRMPDGSRIRGDIHMLLVGDPGVAKSQLLRFAAKLSPRSVYTSGKSSSAAGLTAAAVRDELADGRWTLEAGALVLADKGLCAVDEIDKMDKKDQSSMHEAMEQQCYHPDTEIWLADGRRVKMGELVDRLMLQRPDEVQDGVDCQILPVDGLDVHTVDLDDHTASKTGVDRVSRHEAPDRFIRLTFSNGREILVTPEHPVYTAEGQGPATRPADAVEPGMWVPAPRKVPNAPTPVELQGIPREGKERDIQLPETLSGDLAEVLGFIVAEGHAYKGSSHEIGFSNTDPRLLDRVAELMDGLFGLSSTDATNAEGTTTKRWVSTKLHRWFEENFPEVMAPSRDKRIPAKVLGASEESIRRFLVGAFLGDGSVEPTAVGFSTASRGLAEDYADALLKLGIATRIHHNGGQDTWKTYVMGDSLEAFEEAVADPVDDRRSDVLDKIHRGKRAPRHHDVLPTTVAREIRQLRRLLGLPLTGYYRQHLDEGYGVQVGTVERDLGILEDRITAVGTAIANASQLREVRDAIGWSRRRLAEEIDEASESTIAYAEAGGYDPAKREALASQAAAVAEEALARAERGIERIRDRAKLRYYRVTDVEVVPNEGEHACDWVYDVTVEPTHTFVGQGVVLHNTISIAKAGITAELRSRCAILGAANPKFGRFDQNQPLAEQITMEPALMSRFDVIFTLTDRPEAEKDRDLAEHIMKVHRAGAIREYRRRHEEGLYTEEDAEEAQQVTDPPVDKEFLRKYIAYAKRECFPVLTEEAHQHLQDYYVSIRKDAGGEEGGRIPMTPRQLEALVRLTEASARMRLSNRAEVQDAKRAIDIVKYWIQQLSGGTGLMDIDLVASGVGHSQRERIRLLLDIIRELSEESPTGAPKEEIVAQAAEKGINEHQVEDTIRMLKNQRGTIYSPDNGQHFKLVRD